MRKGLRCPLVDSALPHSVVPCGGSAIHLLRAHDPVQVTIPPVGEAAPGAGPTRPEAEEAF